MDLSIVIPMFNESENAEATIHRVEEALASFQGTYEIIPVNDGSLDNTLEVLKRLQSQNGKVRVVSYATNIGRGMALRKGSYGAWLGKTNDLGIISAVFFRERVPERIVAMEQDRAPRSDVPAPAGRNRDRSNPAAEAGAASPVGAASKPAAGAPAPAAEEYAATGIGRRTDHAVRQVYLDLEPTASASASIRYEYRAQLVRLGVLPPAHALGDPLDRRERARGFDAGFCPEPKR